MRLQLKLLLASEAVLLVLAVALLWPMRAVFQEQIIDDIRNELIAMVSTGVLQLDGDLHAQIRKPGDEQTTAFKILRDQLLRIRRANHLTADNIYTFTVDEGQLRFAVMTHDRPFVYDPHTPSPYLFKVVALGQTIATGLYTDKNGQWVSAAAPIRDSLGRIVGILEINRHAREYFARLRKLTFVSISIGMIGLILSSLLGGYVLDRVVLRPVRHLQAGLVALKRHNFHHEVPIHTQDEFSDLGKMLNEVMGQFEVAQTIASGLLPPQLPEQKHYRLAASSESVDASGGDYYDAFLLPNGTTAILVADVTGHGIGPSLLMASCHAALHALSNDHIEPGSLLERLEQLLMQDLQNGRFVTMVFGLLLPNGQFTYCNAGHAPAMVVLNGHLTDLDVHRAPLGIQVNLGDASTQTTIHLQPRDRIFLASDGVSEAMSPTHEWFGKQRLTPLVNNPTATCSQVVQNIKDALKKHIDHGSIHDDVTILCVDIL